MSGDRHDHVHRRIHLPHSDLSPAQLPCRHAGRSLRLAIEDDDWEGQKEDYESAGETYVTGAWPGDVTPYSVPALPIPSHFGEALQRKAEHFEVLLGLLKVFALPARWRPG